MFENRFLFIHGLVLKCKLQHSNLFLICSWMSWTKRQKVFPKPDVKLPETLNCVFFFIIKRETVLILFYLFFLSVEHIHCLFINKLPFSLNETYMSGYFNTALIIMRKKISEIKTLEITCSPKSLSKRRSPLTTPCQILHESLFLFRLFFFFPAAPSAKCTV